MSFSLLQRIEYRAGALLPLGRQEARPERGVLSVTFDDFPRSAWLVGGGMLAAAGGRGTYYLSGRFHGASVDGRPHFEAQDVADLVAAGHEVGCHTFDHASALEVRLDDYLASVRRNAAFLDGLIPGHRMRSHAFPFGHVRLGARLALRQRFGALRGIEAPRTVGRFDPTHLRAGGLEERREGTIDWPRLISEAARTRGWLVLFTHGVSDSPTPFDARPAALERILGRARQEGLDILPVGEALDRMRAGSRAGAAPLG